MRFEVKGGGIAAILFAMTVLSGAVFLLGLLAGYDVGRQAQIDTNQLATSYPLQPAPAAPVPSAQTPTQASNPTVQSGSRPGLPAAERTGPVTAGDATSPGAPASAGLGAPQPNAAPAGRRFAAASSPSQAQPPPAHSPARRDAASADSDEGDAVDESSATSDASETARHRIPAPIRHKPYNIQIEAAMDMKGADQMMARLEKLGYTSHLVPTEIAGQRWYKVEVGPYATAQEATTAEAELRQRYDATYGGVARGNSAGENSANVDSEE